MGQANAYERIRGNGNISVIGEITIFHSASTSFLAKIVELFENIDGERLKTKEDRRMLSVYTSLSQMVK